MGSTKKLTNAQSVAYLRGGGGRLSELKPSTLKGKKIVNFVTFTPNLIPKSLKIHHFLNDT